MASPAFQPFAISNQHGFLCLKLQTKCYVPLRIPHKATKLDAMNAPTKATSPADTTYQPAHLGRRSQEPLTEVDRIPWRGQALTIELHCTEFTSLCPVTQQPDFGSLTIRYQPGAWLIETKSLNLYLWHFRERGLFNEELVAMIADDLHQQIAPVWLEVVGGFNSRGGIAITATASRGTPPQPAHTPQP